MFRCILLVALFTCSLRTQEPEPDRENGLPFIRNYTAAEYKAYSQNWDVTQDMHKILYFANNDGVLQYDGETWKLIEPHFLVRSLAVDGEGTVFVGAFNDLGYLEPDSTGQLRFISLKSRFDRHDQSFTNVWRTEVTSAGVFFQTSRTLYFWNHAKKEAKTFHARGRFRYIFSVNDTLYAGNWPVGITRFNGASLEPIPDGDRFVSSNILSIMPFHDGKLLLFSRDDGLFLYDGRTFKPFKTDLNQELIRTEVTNAIRLSDHSYALGTRRGGVFVMKSNGRLSTYINQELGLQSNTVWNLLEDHQRGLWLALDNGITRIESPSQMSIYNVSTGLQGGVRAVSRFKDNLYVGTTFGLYRLLKGSFPRQFAKMSNINGTIWDLATLRDGLIVGAADGIYDLTGKRTTPIFDRRTYCLHLTKGNSNRLLYGFGSGLGSFLLKDGKWVDEGNVNGITEQIRNVYEARENVLWLGTRNHGVLKVVMKENSNLSRSVERFGVSHGLPHGYNEVYEVCGEPVFRVDDDAYVYNSGENRFYPDSTGWSCLGNVLGITPRWGGDGQGFLWLLKDRDRQGRMFALLKGGEYKFLSLADERLQKMIINALMVEPDHQFAWFGNPDGLVRYNLQKSPGDSTSFGVQIRRVTAGQDRLLFGGTRLHRWKAPELKYQERNVRFSFASTSFFEQNRFQYYLEGYDEDWLPWTQESRKDYTNLSEGSYIFHVRARSVSGQMSPEDVFEFTVSPPWFRSLFVYFVYLGIVAALVTSLVKWRSRKLRKEKIMLQKTIRENTREIKAKNLQLEHQKRKLEEIDKLKSNFFTNISHEFRTPLTLIIGPAEQMLEDKYDQDYKKGYKGIVQNAKRLLRLVNELLNLSRIESGSVVLRAAPMDIIPFVKGITFSFQSLADRKEVSLTFRADDANSIVYFDKQKMEIIVSNLLSNAIKFAPRGGYVHVEISSMKSMLRLSVRNNGKGIPTDQLEIVFDRFYQVEDSDEVEYEGTGVGLALTKELVELHHGRITATSSPGVETEFAIDLPIGSDHLSPKELKEAVVKLPSAERDLVLSDLETSIEKQDRSDKVQDQSKEGSAKKLILVVEDNADVRAYICSNLFEKYRVFEAVDGRDGLDKAADLVPDLIVSDVMMPKMNGIELNEHIKSDERTSHIPVILLTAKASSEDKVAGLRTGADDYLTKPFNADELLVRIENLIRTREKLREKYKRYLDVTPILEDDDSMDDKFLRKACEIVESHLEDPAFGVEQFSEEIGISKPQLFRKLKALTNQNSNQFIRSIRLKHAASMLRQKSATVSEVTFRVGFTSSSYFAKCFKEQFGKIPSEYA